MTLNSGVQGEFTHRYCDLYNAELLSVNAYLQGKQANNFILTIRLTGLYFPQNSLFREMHMSPITTQFWPKLITLITALLLSACGGPDGTASSPNANANVPASLGASISQKKSIKRKGLDADVAPQIMIGYSDGSVRQLGGASVDKAFPSTGIAGGNAAITQMVTYESGDGSQSVAVAESDGSIWTTDGKGSWTNIITNVPYGPVLQIVPYKNGIIATFAMIVVAQYVNGRWYRLHESGWNLDGSIMSSDNDKLVIALADGEVFDWDGSNHAPNCDGHGNSCGWTDLQGPRHPINSMTVYGKNNGQPLVAIATKDSQLWQYDGITWNQLTIAGLFSLATPYQSQNDGVPSGFLFGSASGSVELATGSGTAAKFTDVFNWDSTDPIRQLTTRNGSVFAGMQSGLVLQATPQSDGNFKQQVLAKPRWGTELAQIVVTDSDVFIRYANGVIEKCQWDSSLSTGKISDMATAGWPQTLNQMTLFNDSLLLGFGNGSSRQWNGVDKYLNPQPHDASWLSAVKRIVNWNRTPVVELANGAVEVLNYGDNWTELAAPADKLFCNSDSLEVTDYDISILPTDTADGLTVSMSGGVNANSRWYSSYVIKNIFSPANEYQTTDCAYSYSDSGATTVDKLAQTVAGEIGIFAFSSNGITIRRWSGNTDSPPTIMTHPSWPALITQLFLFKNSEYSQEKLIVGLANGDIEQWDPSQAGNGTNGWSQLYDSIYNTTSPITQIIDFGGNLAALLNNGEILLQYSGGWYDDHINYLEATVTQMVTIGDKLTVGLANGEILQWKYANPNWVPLPGNGNNSAVSEFATTDKLIVGYADGSVQQWDGKNWSVLEAAQGLAVTQLLVQ